jgi:hypothetical protein
MVQQRKGDHAIERRSRALLLVFPFLWRLVRKNAALADGLHKLHYTLLLVLRKVQMNEVPSEGYDPYEPLVEWFSSEKEIMPLSG